MPEILQNYNFNGLYICFLLFLYNIWKSNYDYINIFFSKIYLFNYTSLFIIINIIGLYFFLKHLTFQINFSIKYK